jgi:hypothetical protein
MPLRQLKPAVPKCWLFATCGLMWSAVGLMMCKISLGWLMSLDGIHGVSAGSGGVVLALGAFYLGFRGIARKNIERLRRLPERGCFFAFQAWKSYLIILFMIVLGVSLRHSSIPRIYLAVVYATIGGALFLGSLLYYRHLFRLVNSRRS